jgi:hypothetical protein
MRHKQALESATQVEALPCQSSLHCQAL